ncbi:hypothetical protein JVT61DRAFT_14538 [Boletus reticuloceps]|uniref:RRM domain-containing protein n=1 Tax=Boletus reticuloceps TaxID=495285 RepID=A0A8I3ACW8_9AGAM|nr:hypothetical protein JVT61DRAFT_14538 [Boletus reticuloceps]
MSRLIVKNIPPKLTTERLRKHFEQKGAPPGTITDIKIAYKRDGTCRQFAFIGFKTSKEAATARDWFDRTFIESARINVMIVEGAKDAPTPRPNKRRRLTNEDDNSSKPGDTPVLDDSAMETIQRTSRLFLRNLAFSCTDNDLLALFRPFGEIAQAHIPLDPVSKQSKGLAYVTFVQPSSALAAYEGLDKKSFQGRLLHILPAVERKGGPEALDTGDIFLSIKGERKAKRNATAGREFNWSMLYMNSDAVVSSIADRLSIPKADILNPESSNAAVKLALAETHVIQETKSYLESQGVILSSFSSRGRSDTILLVKNIPYGTSADQIRELFEVHGKLSRVIVPPAGTMAVVEFEHAVDANKAFRAVAYRRLGNSVIYLEKGPLGMFQEASEDTGRPTATITSGLAPVTIAEQDMSDEEDISLSAGSTLFVKNLSFSTTTERLKQVFRNLPDFAFARIQTKPDPKRSAISGAEAPRLSMGYGFVGFKTVEGAKRALKGMEGFTLDGHTLHVKFAGRGTEEDASKDKETAKSRTTKMIVKNVPFEATKKDIRELFGAHGQLKSVRLPKRFDARSRGFAFLEFVTRHEAENAYAALRHTHLLGRHLVLEWAEEAEQDLDALRQKAGVGYGGGIALPGKRRKFHMDDGEDEEAG